MQLFTGAETNIRKWIHLVTFVNTGQWGFCLEKWAKYVDLHVWMTVFTEHSVNGHWKQITACGLNKIPEIPCFSNKNLSVHFTGINRQKKNSWNSHALNALIRVFKIHFRPKRNTWVRPPPDFLHMLCNFMLLKTILENKHTVKEKI